jgi:C1A family cysteine protease
MIGTMLLALALSWLPSDSACCINPQFINAKDGKLEPKKGQQVHFKGYKPPTKEKRAEFYLQSQKNHGGRLAMLAKFQTLPAAFDCRDKGWVIPVGDQGQCGSCYLYSTSYGTMSAAFVKAGYGKPDGSFVMSPQYGMDCHNFGGCNGGNGTEVIDWAVNNGWYAEKWVDTDGKTHSDYPAYQAQSRSCRKVAGAKFWKPASWGYVSASQNRPASTDEIKTALYNFGSLNVSLDAGGQFGNGTGTITSLGTNIDHEIELIAWDDNKDGGAFLLKNQWSTDWGNQGMRWCTYHACQQLVDVFFVSATPLPPPPTPPPPVPPPSGVPVITAPATTIQTGKLWTYQIVASNSPTSYDASGPITVDKTKGVITWAPPTAGSFQIGLFATNATGTGTATLSVTVSDTPPPPPPPPNPSGVTITLSGDLAKGTYGVYNMTTQEVVPLGTSAALKSLNDIINPAKKVGNVKGSDGASLFDPPVVATDVVQVHREMNKRMDVVERNITDIAAALKLLLKSTEKEK